MGIPFNIMRSFYYLEGHKVKSPTAHPKTLCQLKDLKLWERSKHLKGEEPLAAPWKGSGELGGERVGGLRLRGWAFRA